jgi:hypothetical protein
VVRWVYLVFMNSVWVWIPAVLLIDSCLKIVDACGKAKVDLSDEQYVIAPDLKHLLLLLVIAPDLKHLLLLLHQLLLLLLSAAVRLMPSNSIL